MSPDETIARIGPPAASYTHRGTEHWLYPNAVRVEDGERTCPEMLFEDGRRYQITWLPEEIMKKSVVAGESKNTVIRKFGQPDTKRVFSGRELWEYEQVQFGGGNNGTLTIFLEFDGDKVFSSAGN